jgi:hypothetical protein
MKEIQLTQGLKALVDDNDYEEFNKYKWYAHKGGNTFYVERHMKGNHKIKILMHRAIMNVNVGMFVDHIDGNGLNNCKSNLRIVTTRQNLQNRHSDKTSKYVGVFFDKVSNKWIACIRIDKIRKYIGRFENELDAHKAYLRVLDSIGEVFVDNI